MKRRSLLMASIATAAAVSGGLYAWRRGAAPETAPDLWNKSFVQPDGGELKMAALRGQPLLLNFWATWCPPCLKEMPLLDKFYGSHRANGWQVIGLAVDTAAPVREYLGRLPMSFPIGLTGVEGIALSRNLGNTQGGLPFTVVFERDGGIFARKIGIVTEQDLDRWTATLR